MIFDIVAVIALLLLFLLMWGAIFVVAGRDD